MWEITSARADALFDLSNLILILGAVAVLVGTIGSIKMGGIREQFSNERISSTEGETARAQLELERLKAPRSLSDEQIARIKEKISPFAGQQFGAITYWNVKEPTKFTQRIWVQRAPGIPCALCYLGADDFMHNSGKSRRGNADSCLDYRHCEECDDEAIQICESGTMLDCFAEPVIGRAFARPVGSQ
jgi:hypothetical protein